MFRIYVGGAGGAPSNNFIKCLRDSSRRDYLIGASSSLPDLFLADVDEKHVVPVATDPEYTPRLSMLLAQARPDFLHVQHDFEVRAVSRMRDSIEAMGVKTYLPAARTVEDCVDKYKTYERWKASGVRVPTTLLLHTPADLARAFDQLGEKIWIRACEGGGGTGALPTDNYEFAKMWIDRFRGWGQFSASQLLTSRSVTWLSLWHHGELVVAQGRRRHDWSFGNRTLSGVTGVTAVGETCSDATVDRVAQDAICGVDSKPHGVFAVDMTYGTDGWPYPTEINIGRFFTTHYFFCKAGLNLPEIYCNIALKQEFPTLERRINPLPDGLLWVRGMDVEPVLVTRDAFEQAQGAWQA
jgi:carbamoyl-phosphate synthase large subunit